jgi:hypothetical protein
MFIIDWEVKDKVCNACIRGEKDICNIKLGNSDSMLVITLCEECRNEMVGLIRGKKELKRW